MPRYTIAYHDLGPKDPGHYDLFFEREGALKSWRVAKAEFSESQKATEAKDHALKYLDFEGKLSGDRGTVSVWDTGQYLEDAWGPGSIQVALSGKKLKTRLRLVRSKTEGDPTAWAIEDATPAVRRVTSALLHEPTPDPAPTRVLDEIHVALTLEEQTLVTLANQFLKAAPVEWSLAGTDAKLRARILAELSKWRHPWLESAKRRAQILDELARTVSAAKPKG